MQTKREEKNMSPSIGDAWSWTVTIWARWSAYVRSASCNDHICVRWSACVRSASCNDHICVRWSACVRSTR